MGIVGLCWDRVEVAGWRAGPILALWPDPVDHDQCFALAGFDRFADSDAAWDADLDALVDRAIAALSPHGTPTPGVAARWPWRRRISPRDRLVASLTDDQHPPWEIRFGSGAAILASDGHPILWVWLADADRSEALIAAVAPDWPIGRVSLRWAGLLPAIP